MADLQVTVDVTSIVDAERKVKAFQDSFKRGRVSSFASGIQRLQNEIRQLRDAKQKGIITQRAYRMGIYQVNRSMRTLGLSYGQARRRIQQYEASLETATEAQKAMGAAANTSNRRLSRYQVITQQAGYQLGDFIVQVQSGTNAFVAFGQQATQVAGTLTLLQGKWVLIGTVLGVAIPLLTAAGAAFMRVRQEQDQAADSVETLQDKYENLIETLKEYQEIKQLTDLGVSSSEFIAQRQLQIAQTELANAREALNSLGPEDRAFIMVNGVSVEQDTLQVRQAKERISRAILEVDKANLVVMQNQARVDAERLTSVYEEEKKLSDKLRLNRAILDFGKDSQQVAKIRRQQELEAYANQVAQLDVTDSVKISLIESFKAVQDTSSAVDALTDSTSNAAVEAEALRDALMGVNSAALGQGDRISVLRAQIAAARGGRSIEGAGAQARTELLLRGAGATDETIRSKSLEAGRLAEIEASLESELRNLTNPRNSGVGGGRSPSMFESLFPDISEALNQIQQYERGVSQLERALDAGIITSQEFNNATQQLANSFPLVTDAMKEVEFSAYSYEDALVSVMDTARKSLEDAFMSMGDNARDAVTNILKEVYRLYVIRPMIHNLFGPEGSTGQGILGGIVSNIFGSLNPNATGNAFSKGNVIPFANGGVVGGPTLFPMSGNNTGLMGEAGPEAIMPLERGPDGKLGVKAHGAGSAPNIHMHYNFQGGVTEADLARAMPQMVEQTKRAVVDTVQRGGSLARVFRG